MGKGSRGDDDLANAGAGDCLGAGAGLSLVAARFERDKERRAAGAVAGLREGFDLGMWSAELLVPAFGDQIELVVNEDRADGRIRLDGAQCRVRPARGRGP